MRLSIDVEEGAMKYGMPTLIELDTLEDNVLLCKALNLDFVEINMNFPEYQLDNLDHEELNRLQLEHSVFFTFHLAEDIDIGHLNATIREAYLKDLFNTLELMSKIGATVLNMHMSKGIFVTLPERKINIYEQYINRYNANILTFKNKVSPILKDKGIQIYIENTGIYDRTYIKEAVSQLLSDESFRLTWDVGHDHSSGHKDKAYMYQNLDKIHHYHIHDAIASQNHMTLYDGDIDVEAFFKLADTSSSTVVIETKTINALKASINRLNQRGSYANKKRST